MLNKFILIYILSLFSPLAYTLTTRDYATAERVGLVINPGKKKVIDDDTTVSKILDSFRAKKEHTPTSKHKSYKVIRGAEHDLGNILLKKEHKEHKAILNFKDADIESVIKAIAGFLHKNFLLDPRVRGSINLVSNKEISQKEAYSLLLASLRMHGFTIVKDQGFYKVVSSSEYKIYYKPSLHLDHIVTKLFILENSSSEQVAAALKRAANNDLSISSLSSPNAIIVSDYVGNMDHISKIIADIDKFKDAITAVPLHFADIADIAPAINQIIKSYQVSKVAGSRYAADLVYPIFEYSNNIILLRGGSKSARDFIANAIQSLDKLRANDDQYHIYYLKYANSRDITDILRGVLSGTSSQGTADINSLNNSLNKSAAEAHGSIRVSKGGSEAAAAVDRDINNSSYLNVSDIPVIKYMGVIIQGDPRTNSIIIKASNFSYQKIRKLISKLDIPQAQVLIESLIVEVSADKGSDLGFQFKLGHKPDDTGNMYPFAMTNYSSGGNSILGNTIINSGQGLSLGISSGLIDIPGLGPMPNLGLLARFLESRANANVLSAPVLITVDNKVAEIVVGQNVPFVTGSFMSNQANTNIPFQTIERKNIGLTLKVLPQIGSDGTIKLSIFQEVSSVQNRNVRDSLGASDLVTNNRYVKSTVVVHDGQVIAIGGMIEDRVSDVISKVPLLGDFPILGELFTWRSRKHYKTNLMVFLRPQIVLPCLNSDSYSIDRYELLHAQQKNNKFSSSSLGMIRDNDINMPDWKDFKASGVTSLLKQ